MLEDTNLLDGAQLALFLSSQKQMRKLPTYIHSPNVTIRTCNKIVMCPKDAERIAK